MFCGKCGNQMNENEIFCSKCGCNVNDYAEKTVAMFSKKPEKPEKVIPPQPINNDQYDPISGNTVDSGIKKEVKKDTEQINPNNPYAAYKQPYKEPENIGKTEINNDFNIKKKSNTGLIIGIIASGIALVAVIVTLVFLLV